VPSFRYRARSAAGAACSGTVEATDFDLAIDRVKALGLVPVHLEPTTASPAGANSASRPAFSLTPSRRVPARELILFARQLETMLDAGLPLLSILESLHGQATHPALRGAIDRVRADVEGGSTLTEAMRRHPRCFPEMLTNLVHAGEEGGLLVPMLDRIATLLEHDEEMRQRIQAATFYPALVIGELVLAFGVLVRFVLPRFASLFRNLGADLPLPTRILIALSDGIEHNGLVLLLATIALAVGGVLWARTEPGRERIDGWLLRIPLFGPILLKGAMARFARVLAALVDGGIPVADGLAIARGILGNRVLEAEIDRMREGLVAGRGLAAPVHKSDVLPPLFVKMIGIGEETGSLDKMLVRTAVFYERDVDYAVRNLASALEPALLVVLGAAVLFTALAVFLPLWNLMNAFRH